LKIDKSFVDELLSDANARSIACASAAKGPPTRGPRGGLC